MEKAKKIYQRSNFLLQFLYVLGIPGINVQKKSKYFIIVQVTSRIITFAVHLYILTLTVYDYRKCSNNDCLKVEWCDLIWKILISVNWCILYLRRSQMKQLLYEFENFENKFQKIVAKNRQKFNYVTTFLFLLCMCVFVITCLVLSRVPEDRHGYFRYMVLNASIKITPQLEVFCVATFLLITRISTSVTPLLLTLLYIYVCLNVSQMIKECNKNLKHPFVFTRTQIIVFDFLRKYDSICGLFSHTEKALSLEVFCLFSIHFTVLFGVFAKVLGVNSYSGPVYNIVSTTFDVLHFFSFFAITFFASSVHRQDKALRDKSKDIAFRLSLSKDTEEYGELLSKFMESKQNLIFTAWSTFKFTRSFLFSSLGMLITYNLLILQLNGKDE